MSNKANRMGYIYFITNYGLNQDNLVLSFLLNNVPFISFGNMQTNATLSGNILIDDLNDLKGFQLDFANQPFDLYHNGLFMVITPEQLLNSCRNKVCFDFVTYNKLTPDSNPLLLICELKDIFPESE